MNTTGKIKVLGISGSLSPTSAGTAILKKLAELSSDDISFSLSESIGNLPHFSPHLDNENLPESVSLFRKSLQRADVIVICTPEYAHSIPGSLKNALDWVVSSGEFVNKPVGVISTSPSGAGGKLANDGLVYLLNVLSAKVQEKLVMIVPHIRLKVNQNGEMIDSDFESLLKEYLEKIKSLMENMN